MKKIRLKKADRYHIPSVGKGHGSHSKLPPLVEMVMVLPPKERYINIHEYCLQLWDLQSAFLRWTNGDVL